MPPRPLAPALSLLAVLLLVLCAVPVARGNLVAEQLFVGTWVMKRGSTVSDTFVFERGGTGKRTTVVPWGDVEKDITWEVSDGLLKLREPMYASKTPVEKRFEYSWGDDYETVTITDEDTGDSYTLERITPLVPPELWVLAPFVLATLSVAGAAGVFLIIRRRRKAATRNMK